MISIKYIAKIVKTLLVKTLKFQAALPKRNFPRAFFSGNFYSNIFFRANAPRRALQNNFILRETPPRMFSRKCDIFQLFFGKAFSKKILYVRNQYWFCWANNCCCGRAVKEQLSRFTWRNTVTFIRTLVKSHKCLKGTMTYMKKQKHSPEDVLEKICPERFHEIHQNETAMKPFFSKITNCSFTEKNPMPVVKSLIKSYKCLKGTETFARKCLRKN